VIVNVWTFSLSLISSSLFSFQTGEAGKSETPAGEENKQENPAETEDKKDAEVKPSETSSTEGGSEVDEATLAAEKERKRQKDAERKERKRKRRAVRKEKHKKHRGRSSSKKTAESSTSSSSDDEESGDDKKKKRKRSSGDEKEKLRSALIKQAKMDKRGETLRSLDDRSRPYNSMKEEAKLDEVDMEAYRLRKIHGQDPMARFLDK